jgi:hypothetical protein
VYSSSTWHQPVQEDNILVQGGISGFGVSGGCWPVRLRPCVALGPGHHVHGVERQLWVPGTWGMGRGLRNKLLPTADDYVPNSDHMAR